MVYNDPDGKFRIEIKDNRIYEKNIGYWTTEDIDRFHQVYAENVIKAMNGKPFGIYCDLRDYKASNIGNKIIEHTAWKRKNGLMCAAVIVTSAVVRLQINRTIDPIVPFVAFTDEKEADEWLKNKGF